MSCLAEGSWSWIKCAHLNVERVAQREGSFQGKLLTTLLPNHGLHGTDKLLSATFPGVDGWRGGLIEVGLWGGPHFVTVVIWVASFAVPNRPVSVTTTAPCWKAGDHSSSNMGTAVLEGEEWNQLKVITEVSRANNWNKQKFLGPLEEAGLSWSVTGFQNAAHLYPVIFQS